MSKVDCKVCADTGKCPFCDGTEILSEERLETTIYTKKNFDRLLYRFIELSSVFERMFRYVEEDIDTLSNMDNEDNQLRNLIECLIEEYSGKVQDEYLNDVAEMLLKGEE